MLESFYIYAINIFISPLVLKICFSLSFSLLISSYSIARIYFLHDKFGEKIM